MERRISWNLRSLLPALLVCCSILPAATVAGEGAVQEPLPAVAEAPPGGDFTLQSAAGPVSLEGLRGKLVFLYFGYTRCPDVCPTSLAYLAQALNALSDEELQRVQSILVSVDPGRDSVESLQEYAGYFHPNLIGATGSESEVARVAQLYGARYYQVELRDSEFGYAVNHSAATYLITGEGTLRFIFPHQTPPQVLVDAVRYLLAGN